MSTVSAIVVTRHPSERTVELLRTVRPAVDELVVAVDDRAGEGGLGALEELADTIALFNFHQAIERQWEWITSLATGEWILWLDDDELPSAALLRSLRGLVAASDVTHYQLRRQWMWPDTSSRLAEPPWDPEFNPRLYRADRALVWYPGVLHVPVKQLGTFRWVDAPLYHVDLILNSEQARREKARRYERLRPGLRVAGRAQNEAVYLPEGRTRAPATATIPSSDQEAIERFVGLSSDPIVNAAATRAALRGTREAIEAVYRGPSEAPVDDAALEVVGQIGSMAAGVERSLEVWVENRGSDWWPPHGFMVSNVFVSYRWYATDGSVAVPEGLRTPISVGVAPGGRELMLIGVIPPVVAGNYVLSIDLVREHVHWFSRAQRIEVRVDRAPLIGVLVDPSDESSALDAARCLTDLVPGARLELLARDPGSTTATTGYPAGPDPTLVELGHSPVGLVLRAIGPQLGRSSDRAPFDAVVIAGIERLAGTAGRREGLALAATMRRLTRQGVPTIAIANRDTQPGVAEARLSRISARALLRVNRRVAPNDCEGLAMAVRDLLGREQSPESTGGLL